MNNYLTEEEAGLIIDAFSSKEDTVSEEDTSIEADEWAAQMIADDFLPSKDAPPVTTNEAIELLEHQRSTWLKTLHEAQARVYAYEESLSLLRRLK